MNPPVVGVLLAGGRARRMGGGDKCLRPLGGRPLLEHIIARAGPQVARLIINANDDPARFAEWSLPVVGDSVGGRPGPLAGVLAGMDWAAAHAPKAPLIATFATDAPFLPADLVAGLARHVTKSQPLACAVSAGRAHPVFGLWPVALRADLRKALTGEGVRKVDVWTARHGLAEVDFPFSRIDPFFNVNRPEDLARAEELLAAGA